MPINDNLQNATTQVLLDAIQAAKQTGDWMKGQLPDVIHQLLTWSLISDCVTILFSLMLSGIFILSLKRFSSSYKKEKEAYIYNSFDITDMKCGVGWVSWFIVGGITTVILMFASMIDVYDALEIWFAPKVWLLEYASHLLKSAH